MATVFAGKNIVIGLCGSIAAFKVAGWVSELSKDEAMVKTIMSPAAQQFITPLTLGALSGQRVYTSMFAKPQEPMAHIDLAREADLIVVAPATANTLARLAQGMADDLLSTAILAARCPVLIFPAMNTSMYEHPATTRNIMALKELGYQVIAPGSGMMACKESGQGRLVEWDEAKEEIASALTVKDLAGRSVIVTAGPTREALDPARFLSNRSSGKMGYALARAAARRGARVTLISGPTALTPPSGVSVEKVVSARQMHQATFAALCDTSIVIAASAVADFRPQEVSEQKVKKDQALDSLSLCRNPDILFELGKVKTNEQILVGFAAETENLLEAGKKKLLRKNLDLIAINDIGSQQTGFEVDTNQLILLDHKKTYELPFSSKERCAELILDRIVAISQKA